MERVDLLGFGVAAVDDIVQVPAFPGAGSKTHIASIERQGGGQCATALVAAARLGLRCRYAGVLGRNELSDFVRQTLSREGIRVIERNAFLEAMPCYSIVLVDRSTGERTILSYLKQMVTPDDIDEEIVSACRCLFVDHHFPRTSAQACRIAKRLGIPIVSDLERVEDDATLEIVYLADHLVVPLRVARQITDEQEPGRAAMALWLPDRACAAVTDGARGCWFVSAGGENAVRHQPAFPVKAVDTTGCGDVFHGAYAAAMIGGQAPEQAIRFASAAADPEGRPAGRPGGHPRPCRRRALPQRHSLIKPRLGARNNLCQPSRTQSAIIRLRTGRGVRRMRSVTAYVEYDSESRLYVGTVPGLPGAHTQAATLDELQKNLKEVVELCLEEYEGTVDDLPRFVGLQQIEVVI